MKIKGLFLLIPVLLISTIAQAALNVHTWHVISSKEGVWTGRIQSINERAEFVMPDMTLLNSLHVTPANPLKFGAAFDPVDDFDVAYTITLTQQQPTAFSSKTCVFVVTAKGPANPDVRYFSYNGANCGTTVVPGVGEDFYVG